MIGEPPLDAGAVKAMLPDRLPGVAVPIVGAPGTVYGVTATVAEAALSGPAALVATTEQVTSCRWSDPSPSAAK